MMYKETTTTAIMVAPAINSNRSISEIEMPEGWVAVAVGVGVGFGVAVGSEVGVGVFGVSRGSVWINTL